MINQQIRFLRVVGFGRIVPIISKSWLPDIFPKSHFLKNQFPEWKLSPLNISPDTISAKAFPPNAIVPE